MALAGVAGDRGDERGRVARRERGDDRRVLLADQVEIGDAAAARAPGDARLVVERVEGAPQLGVARRVEQRLVEALVVVHERRELAVALLAVVARADVRVDLAQAGEVVVARALARAHRAGALDHLARLEEVAQLGERERRQREVADVDAERDELLAGEPRERLAHRRRADAEARRDRLDHDALPGPELVVDDLGLEQLVDVLGQAGCARRRACACARGSRR